MEWQLHSAIECRLITTHGQIFFIKQCIYKCVFNWMIHCGNSLCVYLLGWAHTGHGWTEPWQSLIAPTPPLVCSHAVLETKHSWVCIHNRLCPPDHSDACLHVQWSKENDVLRQGLCSHWNKLYQTTSALCPGPPLPSSPVVLNLKLD